MRRLQAFLLGLLLVVMAEPLQAAHAPGDRTLTKKTKTPPTSVKPGNLGVTVQVMPSVLPPRGFNLEQNYPNPFNASTVISYTTIAGAPVSLKIYNILGQEVSTLVPGQQGGGELQVVGHHQVVWDATDSEGKALPSGIYLCKMIAGTYVETRKLVLLR